MMCFWWLVSKMEPAGGTFFKGSGGGIFDKDRSRFEVIFVILLEDLEFLLEFDLLDLFDPLDFEDELELEDEPDPASDSDPLLDPNSHLEPLLFLDLPDSLEEQLSCFCLFSSLLLFVC